MVWHVDLKFSIPSYYATTFGVILQMFVIISWISLKYHAKIPVLPLLLLGFKVLPIEVYYVAWQ